MQLDGKLATITGAATGIGRATALLFAQEGAAVAVGDINAEGAQQTVADITAAGGKAWFFPCDVTKADDVAEFLKSAAGAMGGIDIIVNNAGAQRSGKVTEFSEADWDLLMDVNPRSCFFGAKYGVPYLAQRGGGVIVNVASLAGLKGGPGMTAYSASKHAVLGMTRSVAAEVGASGVTVNCIQPGAIDTPMTAPAFAAMPEFRQRWIDKAALGRLGQPEDIADVAAFLASDDARFMSGHGLFVDGGATQRH